MRLLPTAPDSPSTSSSRGARRVARPDIWTWLGISLIATVLGLLFSWALGTQLDGLIQDVGMTSRPARHTDKAVIVGLNETFMGQQLAVMMPRDRLAKLIRVLAAKRPAVIVVDIWLDSMGDPAKDAQLRAALLEARRAGVPVLLAQASRASLAGHDDEAVFARRAGTRGLETSMTAHGSTLAYFADAASGVGGIDAHADSDGVFRTLPHSTPSLPSLPLQAALFYAKSGGKPLAPALVARLQNETTPVDFLGGPNPVQNPVQMTGADEVLAKDYLAALWGGKVIFVGATYEKSLDLVVSPYSLNAVGAPRHLYGVEMLAQSFTTVLAGAPRRPHTTPAAKLQLLIGTLLAALVVAGLALRSAPLGIGAFVGVVALTLALAFASAYSPRAILGDHYWPASPLLFSALLACVGGVGVRQMRSARELRDLTSMFQGHVGKQVLEQIKVKRPELGGEMRDIAVLFCDIRGFSTIGEQLREDPVRLLALLNDHFEPLVHALEHREAYTDNYVGDMVMGVFGAPFSRSLAQDTRNAVLAGIDFIRIMRARARQQSARGEAVIEAGVGIHCGPAVVGYLGAREHMHYTAVGDTVNIASRIESATRTYNERMLVTEEVVSACGDSAELPVAGWEFVAETKLRNRDTPVRLYRRRDLDALVAASETS